MRVSPSDRGGRRQRRRRAFDRDRHQVLPVVGDVRVDRVDGPARERRLTGLVCDLLLERRLHRRQVVARLVPTVPDAGVPREYEKAEALLELVDDPLETERRRRHAVDAHLLVRGRTQVRHRQQHDHEGRGDEECEQADRAQHADADRRGVDDLDEPLVAAANAGPVRRGAGAVSARRQGARQPWQTAHPGRTASRRSRWRPPPALPADRRRRRTRRRRSSVRVRAPGRR